MPESAGAAPQVLLTARGHRCRLLSVKGGNTGYAVNDHPRDANGGIENNPDCGDPDAAGGAMVSYSNHRAT